MALNFNFAGTSDRTCERKFLNCLNKMNGCLVPSQIIKVLFSAIQKCKDCDNGASERKLREKRIMKQFT